MIVYTSIKNKRKQWVSLHVYNPFPECGVTLQAPQGSPTESAKRRVSNGTSLPFPSQSQTQMDLNAATEPGWSSCGKSTSSQRLRRLNSRLEETESFSSFSHRDFLHNLVREDRDGLVVGLPFLLWSNRNTSKKWWKNRLSQALSHNELMTETWKKKK